LEIKFIISSKLLLEYAYILKLENL